jgi:LacI family transcriptional regulator
MLISELQNAAHQRGFDLLVGHAGYSLETAQRQLKLMSSQLFDGLLVMGHMPGDDALFRNLRNQQRSYVALARGTQTVTPLVNVDENAGTRIALEYLYSLGHRRVAFIGNQFMAGIAERLQAFQRFALEKGLSVPEDYICIGDINRSVAFEAVMPLMEAKLPPTAIFCAADTLALGAIAGLHKLGFRVPEDVSITGFDDIHEAADCFPPLTTVRQPIDSMAQEAIQLLMQFFESAEDRETLMDSRIVLEPSLIIRESCTRPSSD